MSKWWCELNFFHFSIKTFLDTTCTDIILKNLNVVFVPFAGLIETYRCLKSFKYIPESSEKKINHIYRVVEYFTPQIFVTCLPEKMSKHHQAIRLIPSLAPICPALFFFLSESLQTRAALLSFLLASLSFGWSTATYMRGLGTLTRWSCLYFSWFFLSLLAERGTRRLSSTTLDFNMCPQQSRPYLVVISITVHSLLIRPYNVLAVCHFFFIYLIFLRAHFFISKMVENAVSLISTSLVIYFWFFALRYIFSFFAIWFDLFENSSKTSYTWHFLSLFASELTPIGTEIC